MRVILILAVSLFIIGVYIGYTNIYHIWHVVNTTIGHAYAYNKIILPSALALATIIFMILLIYIYKKR